MTGQPYTDDDVKLVADAITAWRHIPDAGDGYPAIRMGSSEDMARVALDALTAAGRILPETQTRDTVSVCPHRQPDGNEKP